MARKIPIYQVFQLVEIAESQQDKMQILRENRDIHLERILLAALDDRVEWLLPRGPVPFRPCDQPRMEFALEQQTRTFYLFVKEGGAPENLTEQKRFQLFINLLEGIHPKDAEIMIAAKDKTLPYPSITKDLVNNAYKSGDQDWLYIDRETYSPASETESVTEKYKRFLEQNFATDQNKTKAEVAPKRKRGRPAKKKEEPIVTEDLNGQVTT